MNWRKETQEEKSEWEGDGYESNVSSAIDHQCYRHCGNPGFDPHLLVPIKPAVKLQQFQEKPECISVAELSQIMDTGIEPIAVRNKRIQISSERGHGLED